SIMEKDVIYTTFGGAWLTRSSSIPKMATFAVPIRSRGTRASLHGQGASPGQCADLPNNSNGLTPSTRLNSIPYKGRKTTFHLYSKQQGQYVTSTSKIHLRTVYPTGIPAPRIFSNSGTL